MNKIERALLGDAHDDRVCIGTAKLLSAQQSSMHSLCMHVNFDSSSHLPRPRRVHSTSQHVFSRRMCSRSNFTGVTKQAHPAKKQGRLLTGPGCGEPDDLGI